jgi:translation initiation factor IF-3
LKPHIRINHQINAKELRVIDEDEGNLGLMSLGEALARAEEAGQDLIEISPMAVPPVAKIMDYGKFQYLQNKKEKLAKTKSHSTETKSLQIKIGTGGRDLELKAGRASEFLKEGHRVKIDLFLPGRSKYLDKNFLAERLQRILLLISEEYRVAEEPKKSPKGMTVIIERQTSKKKDENKQIIQ